VNLVTATPAEIDAAIAEIYGRFYAVRKQLARNNEYLAKTHEVLDPTCKFYRAYDVEKNEARLNELTAEREALETKMHAVLAETDPYDREFNRRGGWTRFFLVTSSNGHIHKSMHCSTCTSTTEFGWLPEVSGKTEAEAVAAHGALLCTTCYPTAPVEWTMGKAVPADQCAGSGTTDYPRETARLGYFTGNYGVCTHCGKAVTVTSTRKMRKHKTT
jgi:hypothetical protein